MQIMEITEAQKKAFGARLRERREVLELTLKELVDRLAEADVVTSVSTVSGWERGESSPRDRKIVRLLDALLMCEGELAETLDITMARPDGATMVYAKDQGHPDMELGPVMLRRLWGKELTEREEEALGALDSIDDGRYSVETTVYALAHEVGHLIELVQEIAEHVGYDPTKRRATRNRAAHAATARAALLAARTHLPEAANTGRLPDEEEPMTSQPIGVDLEPGPP